MQCPVYFAKKLATFYDRKTCRGLDLSLFDEVTFRFHVKVYRDGFSEEAIREEFMNSQIVHSLGLPTPLPCEMVSSGSRRGIVFQRVTGKSLLNLLTKRPWSFKKYARSLAALHYQVHTHDADGITKRQKEVLKFHIGTAPLLSAEEQAILLEDLDQLPAGNQLCHGDFHPDNVLVQDQLWIIDWMTGMAGNPLGDVARTEILLSFGSTPERMPRAVQAVVDALRKKLAQEYIRHYLHLSGHAYSEVERWKLPVAAARLGEWIPQDEKEKLLTFVKERIRAIRR
jgi:aminoglycoside phosphotransferase (APT) family kinase protein